MKSLAGLLLLLAAPSLGQTSAATPITAAPAAPAAAALTADTPKTTVLGNTFIAPAGWTVSVRAARDDPGAARRATPGSRSWTSTRKTRDAALARPGRPTSRTRSGRSRCPTTGPTRTAGRSGAPTTTRPRRTSSGTWRPSVASRDGHWTVVIYDMGAGGRREARRAGRADLRPPAAEGLRSARRSRERRRTASTRRAWRSSGVSSRAGRRSSAIPGVALGIVQDGKVVFAGGFGVRELGKPDAGRRRHAVHDRLEHQGADDAAAREAGGRGQADLGHAGDDAAARRSGWATPTPRSRVLVKQLICACTGLPRQDLEWLFQFEGRHAGERARDARDDAADEQVRRAVPVLEPDGRRRRLHRRSRAAIPTWSSAPPTTRPCRRRSSIRSA